MPALGLIPTQQVILQLPATADSNTSAFSEERPFCNCLTPDADLLFDRGFISFEDSGDVRVSPRFAQGFKLGTEEANYSCRFDDCACTKRDAIYIALQ